jgi:hypothetical protein
MLCMCSPYPLTAMECEWVNKWSRLPASGGLESALAFTHAHSSRLSFHLLSSSYLAMSNITRFDAMSRAE